MTNDDGFWARVQAEATAAVEEPAPAPSQTVLSPAVAAIIEAWFVANVHNRELPVQLYNSLFHSKQSLMQELALALAQERK